jgi:P27 family predicted phage terminase small subunit
MGNHNSGRRPQPTKLKVLRGNPGKRPINQHEPIPPTGEVKKPKLSKAAESVWDEIAPVCQAMGTLTVGDVKAFARLCELQATADMTAEQKDAEGFAPFTVSEDYNGAPKVNVHGAIKLEKEISQVISAYYDRFGMTPTGRAKIVLPKKPEQPESKWAGIL